MIQKPTFKTFLKEWIDEKDEDEIYEEVVHLIMDHVLSHNADPKALSNFYHNLLKKRTFYEELFGQILWEGEAFRVLDLSRMFPNNRPLTDVRQIFTKIQEYDQKNNKELFSWTRNKEEALNGLKSKLWQAGGVLNLKSKASVTVSSRVLGININKFINNIEGDIGDFAIGDQNILSEQEILAPKNHSISIESFSVKAKDHKIQIFDYTEFKEFKKIFNQVD